MQGLTLFLACLHCSIRFLPYLSSSRLFLTPCISLPVRLVFQQTLYNIVCTSNLLCLSFFLFFFLPSSYQKNLLGNDSVRVREKNPDSQNNFPIIIIIILWNYTITFDYFRKFSFQKSMVIIIILWNYTITFDYFRKFSFQKSIVIYATFVVIYI